MDQSIPTVPQETNQGTSVSLLSPAVTKYSWKYIALGLLWVIVVGVGAFILGKKSGDAPALPNPQYYPTYIQQSDLEKHIDNNLNTPISILAKMTLEPNICIALAGMRCGAHYVINLDNKKIINVNGNIQGRSLGCGDYKDKQGVDCFPFVLGQEYIIKGEMKFVECSIGQEVCYYNFELESYDR